MDASLTACRVIPGDAAWPSPQMWTSLNSSVGGQLLYASPLAQVCHDPTYDAEQCAQLQQVFGLPNTMVPEPSEFMATWFQNNTCSPFTGRALPCELGNYVSYAINASTTSDVQNGLTFAREHDLRLVIKASGHDWYGKSTGKGALSLWTHNLIEKAFISEYNSPYYTGPAVKLGAGVMGGDAAEFVSQRGHRLVAGSCPTVTPAGGYTQGGGHSLLTGLYGFGADNVLEWEVVTANGTYVIATPTQNSDLYWALSGGGGGTFGVVISMTSRVFPDGQLAVAEMAINTTNAGGLDEYWAAVDIFHQQLQTLTTDHGIVADYIISNSSLGVVGILAPDFDSQRLSETLRPMLSALSDTSTGKLRPETIDLQITESRSYYDLYSEVIRPLTETSTLGPVLGGRLISQENMRANATSINSALREVVGDGNFFLANRALSANGASRVAAPIANNAMQPAFKEAFVSVIIAAAWNNTNHWAEASVLQRQLFEDIMPAIETVTPNTGVYMNEGNWQQANWQEEFYGLTYARLLEIKQLYDPSGLFYGKTSVGSEQWKEDSQGRLCRNSAA
ncbi:hypothetical protein CKM354_000742400 [Cercospora kikuchii]|uniref:FAD-binding PCMH-type domain-containing protein n=1 Tax=Cercospora kikuchii TaxID=84275 RepID=A0A9P3FJ40_9PEZI|nr:uncharacterized protein CKM354_000742400 [Cercospora kikuchii]GIZ44220.1 hypothetical protein CKM354_000742400 [Cercospora kikuchii]